MCNILCWIKHSKKEILRQDEDKWEYRYVMCRRCGRVWRQEYWYSGLYKEIGEEDTEPLICYSLHERSDKFKATQEGETKAFAEKDRRNVSLGGALINQYKE
jgi:NMD protein affecting ribosome stability and mRNA decay